MQATHKHMEYLYVGQCTVVAIIASKGRMPIQKLGYHQCFGQTLNIDSLPKQPNHS